MSAPEDPTAQKSRRGLVRLLHATGYSWAGLRAAWAEAAFRLEVVIAVLLLPLAFVLGRSWVEQALLAASVLWVLIVELLNTGIEAVVDRVGPEWHAQAKRAKDVASAAVLISLALCALVWGLALLEWARKASG